ncbi:7090_t:CDS:2 [Gigaspora rosea]|nr:7090_t:CDS:2 [Gigaspora rosea]
MEDTSEIHIQIAKDGNKSADFDPHDGKPVTLILKHEYMISQNDIKYDECSELYFSDNYGPSVSVSDNKLVSVPIYKSDYHDFKVGGYSILTLMKTDQ